ncbi:MAG: helix-turn-helix domain-containing protein [Eubacteriales bacterium]|nr:helix-turn-helix domain-containing protein [Eubacteriales bacterium]
MDIGAKIKQLRIEKGLTLEELGHLVGVGKSTVRKWEQGIISDIRQTNLAKLSSALGTTPECLMGWDERFNHKGCLAAEAKLLDSLQTQYGNLAVALFTAFTQLNADGQQKAVENVQDLLDVPKYRKGD